MTDFYVDNANGSDAFSGSSESHTADLTGTAATRSTNVYTLDGSPDLSGIIDGVDTIAIVGETSGQGSLGSTIFLITAHDDGADTVTVSPTPLGGVSGLTWSIGGAFATIGMAVNNAVLAGDYVYIQSGTIYTETAISTLVSGTAQAPIHIVGYTTTIADEGKVTITPASGNCWNQASGTHIVHRNTKFNNGAAIGYDGNNTDIRVFINCEFSGNSGIGVFGDNNYQFMNCLIRNNGGLGADTDASPNLVGCIVSGNTGIAVTGFGGVCYRTVFHDGDPGSVNLAGSNMNAVIGNTFDGEGGATIDGVTVAGAASLVMVDNIFHDLATAVLWDSINLPNGTLSVGYNLMNSNSVADYESQGGYDDIGYRDVIAAPDFTNEAGDDYTLGDASPAIDAGVQPGGVT